MTARVGTMSVDGTPISQADMARIDAEAKLHSEQQRKVVRVVASAATDAEDACTLLAMLGLDSHVIAAARGEFVAAGSQAKRSRKSRAA